MSRVDAGEGKVNVSTPCQVISGRVSVLHGVHTAPSSPRRQIQAALIVSASSAKLVCSD